MTIDGGFLDEEPTDLRCGRCFAGAVTLRRWRPANGEPDDLRYWCHECGFIWVVKPSPQKSPQR